MKNPWHKQKTTWLGVISIALGVFFCSTGSTAQGLEFIIFGLGAITGRQALTKIQNLINK